MLLADNGLPNIEIAKHVVLNAHSIDRWRNRYGGGGFEAIAKNLPRGATMNGTFDSSYAKLLQQIIEITTTEKLIFLRPAAR